ncbi:MAG: hypothetical protein MZV70_73255 [Desulfobacterales bacterium]|nr:hypothetical protein [Desulfobacterales bacterium]
MKPGVSTCGVVSGGALGIAPMRHEMHRRRGRERPEGDSCSEARAYVDWFHDNFSTQRCRERTGVDFYQASSWSQQYLLPGERIARCFWHIGKAASLLGNLQGPFPSPVVRRALRALEGTASCNCAHGGPQGCPCSHRCGP